MKPLLLGLVCAFTLIAQPKPGNGTIDGHVFNSLNGAPLRKATVTLRGRDALVLTDDSDVEGKFHFAGLPAGTYRISATHGGFVDHSARYAITLGANDSVAGTEVRLAPFGVITGRILDEDSDPSAGASVYVLKQIYREGRKEWSQVGGAISNDVGEYRLPSLAPGRYLIRAMRQRRIVDNTYGDPPQVFYVPVYYPNATTQQGAVPIDVGVGGDVRGIDIQLFKRPVMHSFQVKGKVVGVPPGSPVINVSSFGSDFGECGGGAMASPPDYTFELNSHAGQCTIQANVYSGAPEAYGSVSLAIGGDIAGLVVAMAPSPVPAGRIRLAEANAQVKVERVRVTLTDLFGVAAHLQQEAHSDSAGKFDFAKPMRPGHYSMGVDPGTLPDGCFVREVRIGEQEISLDDVDIQNSAPGTSMDVILSNTAAKIKGSVVDGDGKPFPISTVTLIAADGKSRAVKQAADDNGNFEIAHLRPGKYVLFAWEEIDNDLWPDPDFRKKYENRAMEVTVGPSDSQSAQVRVILAEEMK